MVILWLNEFQTTKGISSLLLPKGTTSLLLVLSILLSPTYKRTISFPSPKLSTCASEEVGEMTVAVRGAKKWVESPGSGRACHSFMCGF